MMIGLILVLVVSVFFFAMGAVALATPAAFLLRFGSKVLGPDGKREVRAVYGGFGLAMAGILIFGLYVPEYRSGIFLSLGVALMGMVGGLIISAIIDRGVSLLMAAAAVSELLLALALFASSGPVD